MSLRELEAIWNLRRRGRRRERLVLCAVLLGLALVTLAVLRWVL